MLDQGKQPGGIATPGTGHLIGGGVFGGVFGGVVAVGLAGAVVRRCVVVVGAGCSVVVAGGGSVVVSTGSSVVVVGAGW